MAHLWVLLLCWGLGKGGVELGPSPHRLRVAAPLSAPGETPLTRPASGEIKAERRPAQPLGNLLLCHPPTPRTHSPIFLYHLYGFGIIWAATAFISPRAAEVARDSFLPCMFCPHPRWHDGGERGSWETKGEAGNESHKQIRGGSETVLVLRPLRPFWFLIPTTVFRILQKKKKMASGARAVAQV